MAHQSAALTILALVNARDGSSGIKSFTNLIKVRHCRKSRSLLPPPVEWSSPSYRKASDVLNDAFAKEWEILLTVEERKSKPAPKVHT